MSFIYRHRVALGFFCVALSIVFCLGVCCFALARTAAQAQRLTVVIDAGHGGIDGGVVGIQTGTKESDINLSVSRVLQELLEEAGLNVVQTRKTEAGLYGAATQGYKKRDMKKRSEIINRSSPALVISVHQNFFSLSSRRGGQVFYRGDSEKSKTLATLVQNELNSMSECVKKTQALAGDYYVLNCSDYPSVIVEGGFLSNAQDEALLVSEEYQKKLAQAIANGALLFLSSVVSG